ncbi:hypothetical protein BBJ28_00000713 [Nothophytophthora sp. Chile5]|nr:hypothetical protein BBJ28_00000713 [Nothophytophthora sp. Chile5]
MQIDHLRVQSKDLGQGKAALTEEVDELRTQNKQLDQKVFQQEKQINALQVRADALQQQLADKEEVSKKTTDLLESAKLHNEEVDESLKMYRDNHARLQQKLELSISEINKIVEEKQLQREEALLELKSTKGDIRKREEHIATLKVRNDQGILCCR